MPKDKPEIRFAGYTDAWEKRKLGSIAKITIGKFVIKTKQNDDSIYPVYNGGISYTGKYDEYNNQGPKIVVSARGANAGFVNLVTTNYWAGNSCYSIEIIDKSIFSLDYIYSFMKYNQWRFTAYQQAANIPSVSKADMEKFNINFPEFNEQENIGILFQKLDQLITVNQRKVDLLKELKKGFLQKMFPKNGEDKPEIRFSGFTDAWVQRKLTDISEKVTEKNSNNEFSETLTNSAEYGIISQRDFFDKDISNEKNLNTYYVVRDGDFVYNPRISNFAPVGPIKRNTLGRTGVMSPLYYVFRTHDIDGMYLEKYFSSTKWHRFMELNGDTGARADRFAIKDKDFVQMPIPLPSLDEQSKIAHFLESVDNLIAANQRRVDLLKQEKKALLQKMFV